MLLQRYLFLQCERYSFIKACAKILLNRVERYKQKPTGRKNNSLSE